ncbi:MAG: rhodanese-like domain-containing protein [Thermoleophilia bacterium]
MTMVKSRRLFLITIVLLGLLLSSMVAIVGCGDSTTTTTAATTATTKDSSTAIGDRARKVLASNPVGPDDYAANAISGTNLAKKLADAAQKDKIYLLDIRKKADYDKGHIAGASQVEFPQWAAPDNLIKLPKDKKIVVVCYTGNTAAQAAAGMRMLGYDAAVLKAGMMGWDGTGKDATITELNSAPNPDVTTPAGTSSPAPATVAFDKPSDADYKVLAEKANKVFTAMPTDGDYNFNTTKSSKLSENLMGADKGKLFVLDIRKTEDFNKGHIAGVTHIDFAALAVADNLKMLPKDKKIVVVCYTGNTAAQATTILRMLDYDAVVLKFGMMGWDGSGKDGYITDISAAANPVVTS